MIINLKKSVFEDEIKNKKVLSSVVNIHDYHNNNKKNACVWCDASIKKGGCVKSSLSRLYFTVSVQSGELCVKDLDAPAFSSSQLNGACQPHTQACALLVRSRTKATDKQLPYAA